MWALDRNPVRGRYANVRSADSQRRREINKKDRPAQRRAKS